MRAIEALNEKTAEYQELLDARKAEHVSVMPFHRFLSNSHVNFVINADTNKTTSS